jgi:glycerol-3-phosphate responsive antiterminator
MKFEIGDKRKEGLLSLDEVEAITITVKGIKYIIKEGIYDGIILVKLDKEADDSLSIRPINHSSIAIR